LEIVEADLTDSTATLDALRGLDGVFHTAAVFDVTRASADELLRANVGSTENVLRACGRHGVRRIVLTSSAAAVGTSHSPGEIRDEANWNDTTQEPYALSKVTAERRAWALSKELGINLVSVLPGAMLGPGFTRLTPTLEIVSGAIANAYPMAPPIDFAFTDVRDVAHAHIQLFDPQFGGRYIVAGPTLGFRSVLEAIHQVRPSVRVPRDMPAWLARLLPVLETLSRPFTRAPRTLTRGFVGEYVGRSHALSTRKAERDIGWAPRQLADTILDTLHWLDGEHDALRLDN
jgi:dihydroflavonol-4-reductase